MMNDQGQLLGRLVVIYTSEYLHTFDRSCQRVYPPCGKFLTRQILLYFACCDQHS